MPLDVDIKINGRLITTFMIGRLDPLKGEDYNHNYLVRLMYSDRGGHETPDAYFTHRYGDGATRCVENALAAYRIVEGNYRG